MKKSERAAQDKYFRKLLNSPGIQKSFETYSREYDRIAKNNLMMSEKLPNPKTGDFSFLAFREAVKNEAGGAVPNLAREIARSQQAATRTEARNIVSSGREKGYYGLKVSEVQNMPKDEAFKFFFNLRRNEIENDPSAMVKVNKNIEARIREYTRTTGRAPTDAKINEFRNKALNDAARPTAAAITSN